MKKKICLFLLIGIGLSLWSPELSTLYGQEVAVLKYQGGGDWYANPTAVPNLIAFCNQRIGTRISERPKVVDATSSDLNQYPIIFMTGHGHVYFSQATADNLRSYLLSGGFIHISDNYGLDDFIRKEMKKVFPELEFQEIPYDHEIYHQSFNFSTLPKIHEHDGGPAQGFGIFYEGRLVCFYDYQSDLNDGWEDASVHNNPEEVRLQALKMGSNIIEYAFTH